VIYALQPAVLSASLSGETRHQLSRPIPRLPGIIPVVLSAVCFLPPHRVTRSRPERFRKAGLDVRRLPVGRLVI
jgi:hypothetical protein